ncbi:MAG: hypothetical protein M1821_001291 [Bathelium mastoideum]|nr:MAG: hypothetical protein M1821_001291 [Bathelium mastoideum]
MASAETGQPDFSRWEEDQCKAGLARLEDLQDKLEGLRSTIPSIIGALVASRANPQEHFRQFKDVTETQYSQLIHFRATWQSEPISEALEYAVQSGKRDLGLGNGAVLPKSGWIEEKEQSNQGGTKGEDDSTSSNGAGNQETDDMTSVVEGFKHEHAQCQVESDPQTQKIQVSVPTPPGPITFAIKKYEQLQNGGLKWDAECLGTMKLSPAITRCLASRPHADSLRYTLEMIAAYKDARQAPCMACGSLLDKAAQTPPARRSKTIKTEDGKSQEVWEAFHEGCIP